MSNVSADWLRTIERAMEDGEARLVTDLGGRREVTAARLWHGQVLVDWQPDALAGDCLLRTELLRKLLDQNVHVTRHNTDLTLSAPGRVVAALSDHHARLVKQLGGARRVTLTVRLHFENGAYVGGEEHYSLLTNGQPAPLLQLTAEVRLRSAQTANTASPRTSPAST